MPIKQEISLHNYAVKIILNTASHPIEYAKILIQIGYEPIPPRPGTTFFGKPAMKLPNIFQYVSFIKRTDGFFGCYRGLTPKLCGNLASVAVSNKVIERLNLDSHNNGNREEVFDEAREFHRQLKKDVITKITATLVNHPFHVITVRMMAQFIGRETKYSGIFSSIVEIYQSNGITGFFSGIIPRILGELLSIILANTFAYLLNTYVFEEPEFKLYSNTTVSFLAGALTYPFIVVTNCMTVTNSGLRAGQPPYMPIYTSWLDCWANLSDSNQLKRGSSLLLRYHSMPYNTKYLGFTKRF